MSRTAPAVRTARRALPSRRALGLVVVGACALGVAAPAFADAATGTTTATFTVNSGALAISTPTSATLGSGLTLGLTAGSISGQLGSTTVTDTRGGLAVGGWTVTASSTDFTTGTGTGNNLISKNGVTGYSGLALSTTGVAVPVMTSAVSPVNLGSGGTLVSVAASVSLGSNSTTYNPTVSVAVPTTANPGTYTGTITQTVG